MNGYLRIKVGRVMIRVHRSLSALLSVKPGKVNLEGS
jgi:hypothetical protein